MLAWRLELAGGNRECAVGLLGIVRTTIWRGMKALRVEP